VLTISVKDLVFQARLETEVAPATVAAFQHVLPLRSKIIQARWSGEAAWIPFGALDLELAWENATVYPGAGELLLYRGGYSETEILFPYGRTRFSSTMGDLAGNHFATIIDGREHLPELGRRVLWEGAQEISLEEIGDC